MEYPAQRFVIQPSGRLKLVRLVSVYNTWGKIAWHEAEGGKIYRDDDLFATRDEAVIAGKESVEVARAKLRKSMDKLDKKIAQLQLESLK